MEDFKIRIESPKESEMVQRELFRRGYYWHQGDKKTYHLTAQFLYGKNNCLTYGDYLGNFRNNSRQEITVKELLGGKKMKKKKPSHIIVWEEDRDPFNICYSLEEVKRFVKDLLRKPNVKEDSIRIYEIKSIIIPKLSISFRKG